MAKTKKNEPIEEIKVKEAVVESVAKEEKQDFTDEFVCEQLKVINRITDRAKAKRLADRLLMNRKRGN